MRPMGLVDWIINWALKSIRIPIDDLTRYAEDIDTDDDGCVDLGELVTYIRDRWPGNGR